jgi:hypothetical protein
MLPVYVWKLSWKKKAFLTLVLFALNFIAVKAMAASAGDAGSDLAAHYGD